MKIEIEVPDDFADLVPYRQLMIRQDIEFLARQFFEATPRCRLLYDPETGKHEQRWCR